ncbi:MAG: hypothetical protein ACW99A_23740 [Candidatus Kariarchaeaceae archaeon]
MVRKIKKEEEKQMTENIKRPTVFKNEKSIEQTNLPQPSYPDELKGKTLDVYNFLIHNPGFHGVREIQRVFDYKSSGVPYYHLNRLLKAKVIVKNEEGKYGIIRDDIKLGSLDDHVRFMEHWIPRTVYFGITFYILALSGVVLALLGINPITWLLVLIIFLIIFGSVLIRDGYVMTSKLKQPGVEVSIDEKYIQIQNKLRKAITLKNNYRAKDNYEAQLILEDLLNDEVIDYKLKIISIFNLCELLLDELKMYGEHDLLEKVEDLIIQAYDLAKKKNSNLIIIESLLLQYKIAVLDGNMNEAKFKLTEAIYLASDCGLLKMEEKAKAERQLFTDEIQKWVDLSKDGFSYCNRVEILDIKEFIENILDEIQLIPNDLVK